MVLLFTEFQKNLLHGMVTGFVISALFMIMWLWFLKQLLNYFKLIKHGVHTAAVIKGHTSKDYLLIKFNTEHPSDDMTFESSIRIFPKSKYPVGSKIEICYDKKDPSKFVLKGHDLYERLTLFIAISIVFFSYAYMWGHNALYNLKWYF